MTQEAVPVYSPEAKKVVEGGTYQHYKGNYYLVLKIARSSETLEEQVVYQQLYGTKDVWVRPLKMFLEDVKVEGIIKPRFALIGSNG